MNLSAFLERALDARLKTDDETAIVLELILRAKDLRLRCVHLRYIRAKAFQQRFAHRLLLGAGGEQIDDQIELALVIDQQMAARKLECGAGNIGRDVRIAIAIAADPRAEAQDQGQFVRLDLNAVGCAQSRRDFAIKLGQGLEDGNVVIVEAHLDLVEYSGPARAHLVGLPESCNFGQHQLFQPRQILFREWNSVERLK
jgi:hypothetical protein